MWGASFTRPVLLYVGSFSYTPRATLCGELLLHAPCYFMWGASLTHPVLLYVGSFSYTPRATLCGELLLHAPCYFMWGASLTRPVLLYVGSFSYTPRATLCGELLLHAPSYFVWGVSLTRPVHPYYFVVVGVGSLTRPVLLYVGSFSYTPHAVVVGGRGGFSYTPRALLCAEFSLTLSVILSGSFSYTPRATLCGDFLLHAPRFCRQKIDKPMQEQALPGEVCLSCLRSNKCSLSWLVICLGLRFGQAKHCRNSFSVGICH